MPITVRGTTPGVTATAGSAPSVALTGARQPQAGDRLIIFDSDDFYTLANLTTPTVGGSSSGVTSILNADAGTNGGHVKTWYFDVTSTGDVTVASTRATNVDEEHVLAVWVLTGHNAAAVPTASQSASGSPVTPWTFPSIGSLSASVGYLLMGHGIQGGSTSVSTPYTPPGAPWSEAYDGTVGGQIGYTGGSEVISGVTSSGTRSITPVAGATDWAGVMVAQAEGGGTTTPSILFRPGKTWKRRFKHFQRLALDSTVPPGPDADPTLGGYGLAYRWRRDPYVPQQRQLESVPGMLDTAQLENGLLGGATTWEQYNRAATHVDRRMVPQQRIPYESPLGLLDQAQLEVPPPLPWYYDEATYLRTPWLRVSQVRVDQSSSAVAETDPTQGGGYGPEWRRWRRDPIPPVQRLLESVPGMLDTAELENELLGGATTELRTFLPATHVDRREYPQQTLFESAYSLLDQAQLEVSPPLPWWYDVAAYLRTPWLRVKQVQADQSSAAVAAFDPTLAGYTRQSWRRDPYAPIQRAGIQNPDDVTIVGTGATGGWWGVDDSAHHFAQWLPGASDPNLLVPIGTPADPTQAGYGPRWMWYRAPVAPVQRDRESDPNLLLTALLEEALLGGWDDVQRHRSWIPRPWFGLQRTAIIDQSSLNILSDPTLIGYGPRWMWYRPPVAPAQRDRKSDPNLLLTALLENELLGGADDSVRHRAWFARPWFGLQRVAIVDQSSQPVPDFDPTQAGYGPRWMWYRPPVAPVQRERKSAPDLLLAALLEDALLGGWDDILRHRTWYTDRREVPQQRVYPAGLQPLADPLLVSGAEWRYRLIPATHRPRWVLRQWWQQQTFQGIPLMLFEGTITGGVLGGGSLGGIRGMARLSFGDPYGGGLYGSGPYVGAQLWISVLNGGTYLSIGFMGDQLDTEFGETYGDGVYGDNLYPGDWGPGVIGGTRSAVTVTGGTR